MKKINWKIGNAALWTEVVLCYLLPFKVVDNFQYQVGFPIPFISVYDTAIGVNPLMSMALNPLGFLLNGLIIYGVILLGKRIYNKFRHSPDKEERT